jgi:hypothetical protein
MDTILGIILGVVLTLIIKDKPLRIEITHKQKEKNAEKVPDMSEIMNKADTQEDQAYADMGTFIDEINNIMTGGATRGEE